MNPGVIIYFGCVMGVDHKFAGEIVGQHGEYVDIRSGPGECNCLKASEVRPPKASEKVTKVNGYWVVN